MQLTGIGLLSEAHFRDLMGAGWLMLKTLVIDHVWFPEFGYRFLQEFLDDFVGCFSWALTAWLAYLAYRLLTRPPSLEKVVSFLIRTLNV